MNIDDLERLIGQLNLGLVIAGGTNDDLVHLPAEDVKEVVRWLEAYKFDLENE